MPEVNYIVSRSEVSFVKYKSSYYKSVTVKQGVINSFRPGCVSSLAGLPFPLFSLLSGEERKLSLLFTLQQKEQKIKQLHSIN